MNVLSGLLQDSLISTGHVECCTIIKRSDGTIVANSTGYEPTGEQVTALQRAFEDSTTARTQGIRFNGSLYKCVRADKTSVYAKKEGSGFVAVQTSSYIVYGSYSSSMFPSVCVEAVEKLGEYFREKGK
ncbi:hypothetical protein EMCRGX_G034445 [Ephydatia muelleri]